MFKSFFLRIIIKVSTHEKKNINNLSKMSKQ